jgi:predicted homoserine dehydrogenase-like protein
MVDWARTAGFPVVCAGKGTRYLPAMHRSTPKTVWQHFGITSDEAAEAGMNPKMFNSFVDGTKSGIEMAAVANACGLKVPSKGLGFPACGVDDLAYVLRPASMGGQLEHDGTVEVITDLERDGRPVYRDLRWGVYITFKAPSDYARACFAQYGLNIDPSGDIASIYRPIHMIGLELGVSVASAALRGEPTGCPKSFEADVIATAKKDMPAGEVLDGEGGACVWGKLMPAGMSVAGDCLPIGLAHNVELIRPVAAGACLTMADVALDPGDPLIALRRTMIGAAP